MMGSNMVVGKIPHKECRFSIDVMYAIENVPNGLFVVLKGRIEKVRSIPFEIGWRPFPHFERKIGLDIAK